MTRWGVLFALIALVAAGITGCDGEPGTSGNSGSTGAGKADQPPSNPEPPKNSANESDDPVATVRTVLKGIQAGRATAIWDFLPSSYQDNINRVVREFADNMDPEVWKRVFTTLKRLSTIARTKKALLLKNPGLPLAQLDQDQLSDNWEKILDLLDSLITSELKDLKSLKQFDGQAFCEGTGTTFLGQLRALTSADPNDTLSQFDVSRITLKHKDANSAQLIIGLSPTAARTQPGVSEFIRIDGKWFPAGLAPAMEEALRRGSASVEALPAADVATARKQWMALLDAVDEAADGFEKAETTEAFNKVLADSQLKIMPLLAAGPAKPPATSAITTTLTVILQGSLDEATRKEHIAALRILAKAETAPEVTSSDDATTIILKTSLPLQAIVDGVKFGKVVRIDERQRSITVDPGKPQPAPKTPPKPAN
jgi:hypothetical protein